MKKLLGFVMVLGVAALLGCSETKKGVKADAEKAAAAAKEAGEKVGEKVTEAGEKVGEVGDKVGAAVEGTSKVVRRPSRASRSSLLVSGEQSHGSDGTVSQLAAERRRSGGQLRF